MKPEKPNPELESLLTTEMPFGKYKGRKLADLPEHYLIWFRRNGFPRGKLGRQLALLYEMRLNGLMYLLQPFRNK
ncbi:DUF3820 family protein [Fulvivirgaceae bacterium BMA12]|uniref:DUF3820 family protein n=1 Tax=Agaribacillus aureus TaxID=3051825 RepID=A0ABT8L809_9BACT|nr:DUF3820 family protein [Fulvivirgaceae bacterium BMA12]